MARISGWAHAGRVTRTKFTDVCVICVGTIHGGEGGVSVTFREPGDDGRSMCAEFTREEARALLESLNVRYGAAS